MCHCYRFVCSFCFADVFVCICLKPEAYTIAINCTDNDLYISLSLSMYIYIYVYIYIHIHPATLQMRLIVIIVCWLVDLIVCGIVYSMLDLSLFHVFCATLRAILLIAICQVWSIWSWLLMLFQLYASCFVHIEWQRHVISNLVTHMNPPAISSIWSCRVKQIVILINLSPLSDVHLHK